MTNENQEAWSLPSEIVAKAIVLAGELAWKPSDALVTIRWLADHNYAVVGVELWQAEDNAPK